MFFEDVLKGAYPSTPPPTNICYVEKDKIPKQKICEWAKCKKVTKSLCKNKNCNLIACCNHSSLFCITCVTNPDLVHKFTVKKTNTACPTQRKCKFCKSVSKLTCSVVECSQRICRRHLHKLCHNCVFSFSTL